MAEVLVGASTKDLADGWAAATPGANSAYFAAFEGAWDVTVNLDFGAIVAVSLYQLTLAAAILSSSVYARWLGWASAVAGVLAFVGIVVELWSPVGTALDAVGSLLFFVVLIGLGVAMWRRASSPATRVAEGVERCTGVSLACDGGHFSRVQARFSRPQASSAISAVA